MQVPFRGGLNRRISIERSLFCALLPLYVHDLGELEVSGVGGEETGSFGSTAGVLEADLGVDVEVTCGTARRPDDRGAVGLVVLEVITSNGANEGVFGGGLHRC